MTHSGATITLLLGVMAHHTKSLKGTDLGRPSSPGSLRTATKLSMITLRVDEREKWSGSCACLETDGVRPHLARLAPVSGIGGKPRGVVIVGHADLSGSRTQEIGPPVYSCEVGVHAGCGGCLHACYVCARVDLNV
jgi:hypothetical protein